MRTEDTVKPEAPELPEAPETPVSPTPPVAPQPPSIDQIEEYEEKKANRQMRHWFIKVMTVTVAGTFSLFMAGLIYTMLVKNGQNGDTTSIVKSFLETILEMFKIMKNG